VTEGPCPGCLRWYNLHDQLNTELGCKIWEWPCVSCRSPKGAGDTCWNDEIAARMALLDAAAKALRIASSRKEEKDDAEPVAGPRTPA
jgi:hypothetical protein